VDGLRREFARELQRLERRLEARIGAAPDAETGGPKTDRNGSRRHYPDLVTREPDDDDRQVYGAAWPLVEEWRQFWAVRERELARVRKLRARLELLGWARRTLTLGRWRP